MLTMQRKLRSLFVMLTFAVAALVLPGCVPTTWLPDSSGFVYVRPTKAKNAGDPPSGELLHYDLKTKTARVVVKYIGQGTMWPAVSGDGKRIAVSKFKVGNDKAKSVQFVIYDMQGKQVKQSKEFVWFAGKVEGFVFSTPGMLFWSPKADMIVVTDNSETAIYNVAADTLKVLEKTVPAIHGGSPIRPDGKGFLAVISNKAVIANKDKNKSRLVFMDWTGVEHRIDTTPFDKTLEAAAQGKKKDDAGGPFAMSIMFPSGWDGNTAWVGFRREKLTWQVDTVKDTASISDKLAAMLIADKKGEPLRYDFPGDISVHVTGFEEALPDNKGAKAFNKVVIVNHKTGKEEVVMAKAPGAALFVPSPDGNFVNIGLGDVRSPEPAPMHLLVISKQGTVHSKLVVDPTK
ncbi:MAG TPA: hypothetical protein VE988_25725 [Gemmataceae bacterium]|nr:hypothetical protein [Gemmataceae bacterium]